MILFIFILVVYVLLLLALLIYWEKIPAAIPDMVSEKQTKISVVIAVRNEADTILSLLKDINQQDYPFAMFEVVVVDDFSSDDTIDKVRSFIGQSNFKLQVFTLPDSFIHSGNKKRCLQKGIESSTGDLIVTTDGDCRVGKHWLSTIENFYVQTGCKMITGPVTFLESPSLFKRMQTIEFASLIGSGAASLQMGFPNMCNGANLAYEKKVFNEVKGFSDNENLASGDDEFLMHKVYEKYPGKVLFLKNREALVSTEAKDTLKDFINQRKRWASKWGHYRFNSIKILAFFIFLSNIGLLGSLLFMLGGLFPGVLFLEQILLKILLEFVFLRRISSFLGKKIGLFPFLLLQLIYPFYVIFFALGSLSGRYEWKGRNLKTIKL